MNPLFMFHTQHDVHSCYAMPTHTDRPDQSPVDPTAAAPDVDSHVKSTVFHQKEERTLKGQYRGNQLISGVAIYYSLIK